MIALDGRQLQWEKYILIWIYYTILNRIYYMQSYEPAGTVVDMCSVHVDPSGVDRSNILGPAMQKRRVLIFKSLSTLFHILPNFVNIK